MNAKDVEKYTRHDIRWSFARGIVSGVIAACTFIVGSLQLVSIMKGLLE